MGEADLLGDPLPWAVEIADPLLRLKVKWTKSGLTARIEELATMVGLPLLTRALLSTIPAAAEPANAGSAGQSARPPIPVAAASIDNRYRPR